VVTDLQAKVNAATSLGVATTGSDALLQMVTVKQAELAASSRAASDSGRTVDKEVAGERSRDAARFRV